MTRYIHRISLPRHVGHDGPLIVDCATRKEAATAIRKDKEITGKPGAKYVGKFIRF